MQSRRQQCRVVGCVVIEDVVHSDILSTLRCVLNLDGRAVRAQIELLEDGGASVCDWVEREHVLVDAGAYSLLAHVLCITTNVVLSAKTELAQHDLKSADGEPGFPSRGRDVLGSRQQIAAVVTLEGVDERLERAPARGRTTTRESILFTASGNYLPIFIMPAHGIRQAELWSVAQVRGALDGLPKLAHIPWPVSPLESIDGGRAQLDGVSDVRTYFAEEDRRQEWDVLRSAS